MSRPQPGPLHRVCVRPHELADGRYRIAARTFVIPGPADHAHWRALVWALVDCGAPPTRRLIAESWPHALVERVDDSLSALEVAP